MSLSRPTPEQQFDRSYEIARDRGLSRDAATKYATLAAWCVYYGYPVPAIVSGKRSAAAQRAMQRRWDAGDRAGMVVRPASSSAHTRGEAWDVERGRGLAAMAQLAPYLGVRWGGNFRDRDEVHFDLGNE